MNRMGYETNFTSMVLACMLTYHVMKRQAIERLNIASFLLQLLPPPSEIVRAFCTYHCYIFPSYGVSLSGILFREENCFYLEISRRQSSYRWWPALPPDPTGEGGHRDWDALVAVYHSVFYATPPPRCLSSLWWGRRKCDMSILSQFHACAVEIKSPSGLEQNLTYRHLSHFWVVSNQLYNGTCTVKPLEPL